MKNKMTHLYFAVLILGTCLCSSGTQADNNSDIWAAAGQGDIDAIEQYISEEKDVNAREPISGSTPLMIATLKGQTKAAALLIEKGTDLNSKNFEGNTALHMAAFLGRVDIVNLLHGTGAGKAINPTGFRGSYFKNGQIHVNEYGTPEGKPLTKGHQDFKPSWSKTGNMLVFFRRLKNHPVTVNWKTAICVINVDGTGFHQLTDGTHTDFNQTWTRDGKNTPIWNRKNPETGGFLVMQSKVGNKPGQEIAVTDKRFQNWAYTCLKDGRILVQSAHPEQGHGYYLLTRNISGKPRYERIDCELAETGLMDRISISPSEDKVCFEYQTGFKYKDTGRTLYIADFDAKKLTITNAKTFANAERNPNRWFAYPRWTKDESAIVYHASPSLYLYTLKDGSTVKVSTEDGADYRYPHCEATPK